ncbi:MAG: tetratricopeptide repeat protein [Flavobacterium sp.]|nr:MAG: tetratricopeptide repeat protein [Flavobacterium sp.]
MKGFITYCLLFIAAFAFAQEKDKNLPKGNKEFADKNYIDAEANYRIAQSKAPATAPAAYNLGNSVYRQNLPGEAKFAYMKAIENAKTKKQKHLAYHNLGNAFMKEKNYQAAVSSYQNALRNNPLDDETRYNYALAKKMLKDNPPPPPKKDDKKKDDQKDKKQDPKDDKNDKGKGDQKDKGDQGDQKDKGDNGKEKKDKEQEGKDKKDQGDKGDKDKQNAAPSPSKQRMENLLDAMNNEEKKIQEKMNLQKVKGQPKRQEKDW